MGGVGLALRDNKHINYLNPASYSAVDTMSFLFDFGVMGHYTKSETSMEKEEFYGANMDHLALCFPITKWWAASIAILPYSKVGYSIKEEEDKLPNIDPLDYLYTGSGGINQLNLGTSVELFNRLSLGANFKYLFGSIDLTSAVQFPYSTNYSYTELKSQTIVSDFVLDLGLQYSQDFHEKYNLILGAIFDTRTKISAENRTLKRNIFPGSTVALNDSTLLSPEFIIGGDTTKGNLVIPANLGSGIQLTYDNRFRFGLDVYRQDWSGISFFDSQGSFTKRTSIHGGFEIIPDPQAFKGYHKRIAYRLGGHYRNTYLRLEGEQLKDYGISFGVGLPLRNTKSSFNLACEAGRRGTLENNLVLENYVFISFSVTLHDFWFIKRKFD